MRGWKGVRVILYVPEVDSFIMTYDLEHKVGTREWRPLGGGVHSFLWGTERVEEDSVLAVAREAGEEGGLLIDPKDLVLVDRRNDVKIYYGVVPESEARWMRHRGNDQVGLIPREGIVAGHYHGLPIHTRYRLDIIKLLPFLEATQLAACA